MLDDFLSLKGRGLSEIGRFMVNEYLLRQRIKANKQQNSLIRSSLLIFLFINLTLTFNKIHTYMLTYMFTSLCF